MDSVNVVAADKKSMKKTVKAVKKTPKPTGHEQVAAFMTELDHPLKQAIAEVRTIILQANPEIDEHIKWNAPSFRYKDEDRITMNLQGKGFFRLIFHCGAKVRDSAAGEPLIVDQTGLLNWVSGDRAILQLSELNEVGDKKEQLTSLVKQWLSVKL